MWKVLHEFSYTGEPQPFNINPGEYLFICKGAYGGTRLAGDITMRNRGGTSYGIINLQSSLAGYAVVGGNGTDSSNTDDTEGLGGYNGGGRGGKRAPGTSYYNGGGGGGASDIRLSIEPDIHGFESHSLPEEFDEIEYIESDGTQYISTEVIGNQNTSVEAGITFVSSFSGWKCPYGAQHSDVFRSHLFGINSLNMTTYQRGDKWHDDSFTFDLNTEYIIKTTSEGLYIDNNKICDIESTADFTTPNPIAIFTKNTNGTYVDSTRTIMRLHYMKIWDGDTLVRYFVPYKNVGIDSGVDVDNPGFEQGGISEDTGESMPWTYHLRMIDFVTADANKRYLTITTTGNYNFNIIVSEWDANHNYIKNGSWMNQGEFKELDSRTAYFKIVLRYNDVDLYPSDLSGISIRFYSTTRTQSLYDLVNQEFYSRIAGNVFTPGATKVEKTVYQLHTIIKQSLLSRIMVAGGGGGSQNIISNNQPYFTGYGGGVNGGYPTGGNGVGNVGLYPTQTTGYSFGIGQDAPAKTNNRSCGAEGAGGGGGGWFGGYAITSTDADNSSGNGGGGSGYVLTSTSYRPEHYLEGITRQDLEFTDVFMSAGSAEEACVMICEPTELYDDNDEIICDCIGEGTSFPLFKGQYTVKCYGGDGATRYYQSQISRGGFAQGTFDNKETTTAYAHVGGSGTYGASDRGQAYISATHPTLSYNGGGIISDGDLSSIMRSATSAGGGTDLRVGTDSLYARIIVAGGGGGSGCNSRYGGDGGGTSGGARRNASYGTNYGPGTQTAAGAGSDVTISGGFGYGGAGSYRSDGYGGAGGGGWFGGSGTYPDGSADDDDGGSGGSGYVLTESSFKPENYLLDESYYMTDTQLSTGGNTLPYSITKLTILCNSVSAIYLLCHDEEGYKYFDKSLHKWVFLQTSDPTPEDFLTHPVYSFISDDGLLDNFRVLFYDRLNKFNTFEMDVLPIKQIIKTRYYTEWTMTRSSIDADVDPSCVQFEVFAKRKGVGAYAYIEFMIECNITDIPSKETRMYCLQGYTQGSTVEYHEPREKEYLEHIDLLPVGTGNRIPWRFKNYIGTEISGAAISTINSAVCCEHNRCIYSATLCNNTMVRFAKLNLVTNESTILKDIPKNQIGNTYYGDIKVDDNYIYLTSSSNDNSRTIWVTPNSSDTTVNSYTPGNDGNYNFSAVGKMYWLDNHTIAILYRKGVFLFDTNKRIFINNVSNYQNGARRDFVLGKRYALSLHTGNSSSAYVWEIATNTWTRLTEDHGQSWAGSYLNCGCYNDGTFYVTQRNRLHFLDEETMTITKSIPTPYTTIDPKTIEYSNGYLYITIQNSNVIYIYDIANDRFSSTGIPFTMDDWSANGWLRPCSFRGYFFIPQIKLYVTNFTSYAKYNMGYKYDQFIMITNKAHELEQGYEYDDRFVTFTEDNMWIHDGYLAYEMTEIDQYNHIKCVDVDKAEYNKFISSRLSTSESNEEGGEDIGN
jgi:hypothetical protein